ncbi:MAG: glycosyltransferase family 2 protein [Alphaproteobacteria bacterium]|nr:glycosyltransferase family 2 protein [Alphaproteobacteria bacterium]
MTRPADGAPRLSVVVPVLNEAESIGELIAEIDRALAPIFHHEVIVVDDGSTDDTLAVLRVLATRYATLRVMRHKSRAGQSAAVRSGVKVARADWIATLDGDGQNDPSDLPGLIMRAWNGADRPSLVGGVRIKRQDSTARRMAGRFANRVRNTILRDGCPDTGCGIKVFEREVFLDVASFGAMHRFLPALFQMRGRTCVYVPVNHRPRLRGRSKYGNLKRGLIGLVDLAGVYWLKRRTSVPAASWEEELPPVAAEQEEQRMNVRSFH